METVKLQSMKIGTGFRASTLRGGEGSTSIDPFLGVDHAYMSAPTFQPHPHAGFSAVSYLFEDSQTGIMNRDSRGTHNLIQPGGLHWTAAGRGIVHEEIPAQADKMVHMLQIFVNLADHKQSAEPFALSIEPKEVPVVQQGGVTIRVPLGSYGSATSPLQTPTAVTLLDVSLDEGAEVSIPISAGHQAFVLPIHGCVKINGQDIAGEGLTAVIYSEQAILQEINIQAVEGAAQVAVFAGVPLKQPVFWKGSLALASPEVLFDRITAYQRGEFGAMTN
jgi:redox-sensitive bicupin YhaK (pirin superfamily)